MEIVPQVSQANLSRKWILYFAVGLISVLILAACYYFLYWKKTPEYSIGIIQNSVKTHDVVTFERHVDLDTLLSRAFDDIIAGSMTIDEDGDTKTMEMGFAQMLKQPIVNMMKDGIKKYVETGTFDEKGQPITNSSSSGNGNSVEMSSKDMEDKSGLANTEFRGFAYTKKDGETAIVGIKVWEEQVSQEFILDLKMYKLDDGTWRLADITNLADYITKLNEAKAHKLAELNHPIAEQIERAITLGQVTTRKVSKDMFSTELEVSIPITFNDDRSIVEIAGNVVVSSQDKLLFKGPFTAHGKSHKGLSDVMKYYWDMNPFISGEKTILDTPDNALKNVVTVSLIKFSDGSELRLMNELPK